MLKFIALQSTRQLTASIEAKAVKFLETGYQQELTFRHSDGSFSAFGGADSSGSTWYVSIPLRYSKQGRGRERRKVFSNYIRGLIFVQRTSTKISVGWVSNA